MKTGWVIKVEDPQSQDKIHTVLACSKERAVKQCAEWRLKNEAIKIEIVGPYTEINETAREVKVIESQDLSGVFKELLERNPLLVGRGEKGLKIEVDSIWPKEMNNLDY